MSQQRKFIVLSNGLRNHLGHYLETSLSVAEAAREQGFHPILAAHVECSREYLPSWLESHTTFRTDHWVDEPPRGYAGSPPLPEGFCARAQRTLERTSRWARRAAYYLLPPLFYDLGRHVAYCCLPRIAAPQERARAVAGLRRRVQRFRYGQHAELIEQAAAWPELSRLLKRLGPDRMPAHRSRHPTCALAEEIATTLPPPARVADAARRLLPQGLGRELEYALVFYYDLERLLTATGVGRNDHVWLGTAHAREILAVHWAVEHMGLQRAPTFHLEFRHALFGCDLRAPHVPVETPLTHMQRHLLQLHAEWGANDRMRFYTDSAALSRDYESIVDLSFAVLPLPFRARLIKRRQCRSAGPLTIAFLGEARDEKGFPLLPALIEALAEDYIRAGKVRFLIQSNVSQPRYNPQSAEALKHLKRQASPGVELVARKGALSPEDYYALVSQADIVLLPYAPHAYQARTSGAMGEALAAGAAVVVTSGTWLADQLPAGCGEKFDDPETFVAAVKRIIDDFDSYRSAAEAYCATWRRRHSPEALVAALVNGGSTPSYQAAA